MMEKVITYIVAVGLFLAIIGALAIIAVVGKGKAVEAGELEGYPGDNDDE